MEDIEHINFPLLDGFSAEDPEDDSDEPDYDYDELEAA